MAYVFPDLMQRMRRTALTRKSSAPQPATLVTWKSYTTRSKVSVLLKRGVQECAQPERGKFGITTKGREAGDLQMYGSMQSSWSKR
jgi:hypothetical protein